jgi:hypothetical protein
MKSASAALFVRCFFARSRPLICFLQFDQGRGGGPKLIAAHAKRDPRKFYVNFRDLTFP